MKDSIRSEEPAGLRLLRCTLIPAALILLSPPATLFIWYTNAHFHGSILAAASEFRQFGIIGTVGHMWGPVFFGSPTAWLMIAVYAVLELALMKLLPARLIKGSLTPGGDTPAYKANGVPAFAVTLMLYVFGSFGLKLFPPSIIYDHFGELLGALNLAGLTLCLLLYLKGRFYPSGADYGHTGNVIFDYFWGTELHPQILGWDVKMFTNCRFALMGWPLIVISFAAAQYERHGYISDSMWIAVALQVIYVAKFFWWEPGYMQTLDITHDRAGFYICWGCLAWLPSVYTGSTLYLVDHTNSLGRPLALLIFVSGTICIMVNYLADAQRRRVRDTGGKTTVWGKPPVLLVGRYTTAQGTKNENLLLASGWWGLARHFHYVPEYLGAFFWTLPVLFDNALPYFYPAFLAILLTHRAFRDDTRCAAKYGADWDKYRKAVPYRIIPGVI